MAPHAPAQVPDVHVCPLPQVDKDALDAQVEEIKSKRASEAAADRAYSACVPLVALGRSVPDRPSFALPPLPSAEGLADVISQLDAADVEEQLKRHESAAELKAYWRAQSDRTARKEWDLNDPEALRKVSYRDCRLPACVCANSVAPALRVCVLATFRNNVRETVCARG